MCQLLTNSIIDHDKEISPVRTYLSEEEVVPLLSFCERNRVCIIIQCHIFTNIYYLSYSPKHSLYKDCQTCRIEGFFVNSQMG